MQKRNFVCIGNREDIHIEETITQASSAQNINYYEIDFILDKKNIYYYKEERYNIDYDFVNSKLNTRKKYSHEYKDYTGIILIGEKYNGEILSILTHQLPIGKYNRSFIPYLREILHKVKEKCNFQSIDAIIFGGNGMNTKRYMNKNFTKNFLYTIYSISKNIEEILGFTPAIITAPKLNHGKDSIYIDSHKQRIFLARDISSNLDHNGEIINEHSFLPYTIYEVEALLPKRLEKHNNKKDLIYALKTGKERIQEENQYSLNLKQKIFKNLKNLFKKF